jgi:hypothetical protein
LVPCSPLAMIFLMHHHNSRIHQAIEAILCLIRRPIINYYEQNFKSVWWIIESTASLRYGIPLKTAITTVTSVILLYRL